MDKIAFLFPGQGCQSVGMGKDLYDELPNSKRIFELLSEKEREICFYGSQENLNRTIYTQPSLFAMDLACARELQERGIVPQGVAGFSLGEIPALAYAGVMTDEEAYAFVSLRGKVMDECAKKNKGVMFAVMRLPHEEIEEICKKLVHAYPVNYNCQSQVVVACKEEIGDMLKEKVANAGGKAIPLAVSGAFHSPMMDDAKTALSHYLAEQTFREMKIPVYANTTGKIYGDPKLLLANQVNHAVLWQRSMENMIADGFDTFIEVGPGKTLSGLMKKIDKKVRIFNVWDKISLENTVKEVFV